MEYTDLCNALRGKTIDDISVHNGVILIVGGKKYHFVSNKSETESGNPCRDTYIYVDGEFVLQTVAVVAS